MKRHICVHGHFYQPPRENPWTGAVDREPSAAPFHDWNERISNECYEANTQAPILNAQGEVIQRVNNFLNISFDIGPTLLSWLKVHRPQTYREIIEADRQSVIKHHGHGNAMAQVYNHVIMPLASKRDQITQVCWGIRDFEFHFGRKPEGMWLAETAVDKSTMRVLKDQGIGFTVLAPHQAKRVRHVGFGSRWMSIQNEKVDFRNSYRVSLDEGENFHVFFYDGPISRAIAFQGLLFNGDHFVSKLTSAFGFRDREQLVSTATDGESFGHHHKLGEMAIAYSLKKIEDNKLAHLSNFGEFLDRVGTFWEVDIIENSSWSCAHGVERWRSDCGCRINQAPGWNQKWRAPLRDALDFLKEIVDEVFVAETGKYLKDPWLARNQYIDVLLDPSENARENFISNHARTSLNADQRAQLWKLLEAQKFAMFMYTSCGWFFDDISGIEATQVLKFALRALELTQPYYHREIEAGFLKILKLAQSNYTDFGNGEDVFLASVKSISTMPTPQKMGRD